MAGIGEATAIAASIEIGFSLAKTLVAVVSDYKSAREDISCVATEVDATLNQAAELDALVKSNAQTRRLNDRGLKLAEKCKVDSIRIVEKLMRLLTKAGVLEDRPSIIEPEDIEVSNFSRTAWIFLKPRIVVIQRELNTVRIQILLVHTFIDAKSASSEKDRATALKLIPGLQRSRQRALRKLRLAEDQSNKADGSAMSNRGMDLQSAPGMSGIYSPPIFHGSRKDRAGTSDPKLSPGPLDSIPQTNVPRLAALNDDEIDRELEEIRGELAQELLAKLESEVREQDTVKAHEERLRDEAVEKYKQDTRARLTTMKDRVAETRQRLHATFTSELPDSEVDDFLNAQHQKELNDEFVELMIDSYKAPPLEDQHKQDLDTLSQHAGSSRGSMKRYATTSTSVHPYFADSPTSWFSKIVPTRSRRGNSSYFGGLQSKEDLTPIPEKRYTHLQIVSHHDRPSLLPLDNSAFSHHPCDSACDAQRTSTIWACLSPLCETLILDYLSRNCPLPLPTKWQLHSAWPITHQLSRRGRYLQRALLGSQLLSWQGNFVVVFSTLLPRAHSPGSQTETATKDQLRSGTATDSQRSVKPMDAGPNPGKLQPGQEQSNGVFGIVTPQPETNQRIEHAKPQDKPPASLQTRAADQLLSQRNGNLPPLVHRNPFSDHSSWQVVQNPTSMYSQMPYGSMPYVPPNMQSAPPTAQAYGPLANIYSPPVEYFQPGSTPFSPYDQYPSTGVAYAPMVMYGDAATQDSGSRQTQGHSTAANGQWLAPGAPPLQTHSKPQSSERERRLQKKTATPITCRDESYKSEDDTSSSSSVTSGPESIYPLNTSTASRSDSRRTESASVHPSSSSGRKSTVTFSDNPTTGSHHQSAGSAVRRSTSRHISRSDPYRAVHIPSPAVRVYPTRNRKPSLDKTVASDDDSETFDAMVGNDSKEDSGPIITEYNSAVGQHDSDSSGAIEQRSPRINSATVEDMSSEDGYEVPD